MSRLDSFIRRLQAQRRMLGRARQLVGGRAGIVLELGLGNGRTWNHLRELFPTSPVIVFERSPALPPAWLPDPDHLVVGDLRDTLLPFAARASRPVVLVHGDLGGGDAEADRELAGWLGRALPDVVAPGGCLVSDLAIRSPALRPLIVPGVSPDRYHLYRRRRAQPNPTGEV